MIGLQLFSGFRPCPPKPMDLSDIVMIAVFLILLSIIIWALCRAAKKSDSFGVKVFIYSTAIPISSIFFLIVYAFVLFMFGLGRRSC
jgi:hypothetical protein